MARTRSKRGTGSAKKRNSTAAKKIRKEVAAAAARATAAAEAELAASRPKPITIEGFATIPHELRTHILEFACSATASSPSTTTVSPLASRLDIKMTLSFTLASHGLYALVAPLLYRQVWISRPSGLASFHFALSNRPYLGTFVESLHVGPDNEIDSWNPVTKYAGSNVIQLEGSGQTYTVPRTYMHHSLRSSSDAKLLPHWCQAESKFAVDCLLSRRWDATFDALSEAQRAIDVNLDLFSCDHEGQSIAATEHTVRVFEVQAALDLYLMAMRRWEDEQDVIDKQDNDRGDLRPREGPETAERLLYRPLILTGYFNSNTSAKDSDRGKEPYVVSRSDLLRHLARSGSPLDRFDHPLLFARSGEHIVEVQSIYQELDARQRREVSAEGDWADRFTSSDSIGLDYALPNTATVGSLLGLLRATLCHTSALKNLSLTGFLERAMCGARPAPTLDTLRCLSLGPPPKYWYGPLRFEGLTGLEELRLAGIRLQRAEMEAILNRLPALRRLQWTMLPESGLSLQNTIDRLSGREVAPPTEEEGAEEVTNGSPTSESLDNPGFASSQLNNDTGWSLPLVEIRLHPMDLATLLHHAPSGAIREAWEAAAALPDQQRRLLLRRSASKSSNAWSSFFISDTDDLYGEGRGWWEERCGGMTGGSFA